MPTPDNQSLSNWFLALSEQGIFPDSSTIVIGHSVGAVFLLRLLEKISSPIMASIFVAGFTGVLNIPEFDSLNATFIEGDYDWENIKKNAGSILSFSGDNDPYVPKDQGIELANYLEVVPIIIGDGGHLNAEFGYKTFPLLLEKLKMLSFGFHK
jgi:predicted alpha/beta hydrolase family esterase